jgi:hypothetical protein
MRMAPPKCDLPTHFDRQSSAWIAMTENYTKGKQMNEYFITKQLNTPISAEFTFFLYIRNIVYELMLAIRNRNTDTLPAYPPWPGDALQRSLHKKSKSDIK